MRIETHGHQIEITPALREYVDTKLERLNRHFERPGEVRVQLGIEKPHHRAEANVTIAGKALHADAVGVDMYAAIDLLADKLDRLLLKHKQKTTDVHRRAESPLREASLG